MPALQILNFRKVTGGVFFASLYDQKLIMINTVLIKLSVSAVTRGMENHKASRFREKRQRQLR